MCLLHGTSRRRGRKGGAIASTGRRHRPRSVRSTGTPTDRPGPGPPAVSACRWCPWSWWFRSATGSSHRTARGGHPAGRGGGLAAPGAMGVVRPSSARRRAPSQARGRRKKKGQGAQVRPPPLPGGPPRSATPAPRSGRCCGAGAPAGSPQDGPRALPSPSPPAGPPSAAAAGREGERDRGRGARGARGAGPERPRSRGACVLRRAARRPAAGSGPGG